MNYTDFMGLDELRAHLTKTLGPANTIKAWFIWILDENAALYVPSLGNEDWRVSIDLVVVREGKIFHHIKKLVILAPPDELFTCHTKADVLAILERHEVAGIL